jgi:hypothetical protein
MLAGIARRCRFQKKTGRSVNLLPGRVVQPTSVRETAGIKMGIRDVNFCGSAMASDSPSMRIVYPLIL